MSTSGVTTYTLTGQQIVDAAYRKTGIMAKGQSADATELTEGLQALNLVLAELRGEGLNLWELTNTTLALTAGVSAYTLAQPAKYTKVHQAYLQDNTSGSKIPMESVSIFNYNILPTSNPGMPIKYSYLAQNSTGTFYVWPVPDATNVSTKTLHVVGETEIQVITDVSQTIDLPTEWYNAVIYLTGVALAVENNVPISDRSLLMTEAKMHLEMAKSATVDNNSLFFQPKREY